MYRYASTLGPRYSLPSYFHTREAAERHHARCQKHVGDLPGQDTMRVEVQDDNGNWHPIAQEVQS